MIKAVVNEMWHIDEEYRLVKTSNGQPLPDDEPVVVLRARDRLAVPTLKFYHLLAMSNGCNDWFLERILPMLERFRAFAEQHPERMKQPGVTRGE